MLIHSRMTSQSNSHNIPTISVYSVRSIVRIVHFGGTPHIEDNLLIPVPSRHPGKFPTKIRAWGDSRRIIRGNLSVTYVNDHSPNDVSDMNCLMCPTNHHMGHITTGNETLDANRTIFPGGKQISGLGYGINPKKGRFESPRRKIFKIISL